MSTVLEVTYQNGQVELPPDARIAENTRALLILLDESEQEPGLPPVVRAASRTEAWQRLSGVAATDEPPTDQEVREMYTDHLTEKYR
jgi:hypothetical protein